jgi:hypothetical protein
MSNIKFLPVDPALYGRLFIPIRHKKPLLVVSIDVQANKMQMLYCAVKNNQQWGGQVHGLLWVWFLASVRRLRTAGMPIKEEPKWRIDIHTVDP